MTKLPPDSSIDWLIAAGVPVEEMTACLEKEQAWNTVRDAYEQSMGYNPLMWNGHSWERLKKFLLTKTPEEIKVFATWSRASYSTFTPAKARLNPEAVIDLWPQAFPVKEAPRELRGEEVKRKFDEFFNRR